MSILPKISKSLDEKIIILTISKKFNNFIPFFYKFLSQWTINAYSNFKDIETYMILIFLINKDFIFYRKNGISVDYKTFFKDKTLEIQKIKISEISKALNMPRETVRRKIVYLEKVGVIKRTKQKIFIDRSAYETAQPKEALKRLSKLVSISSKILKQENKIHNSFSSEEVSDIIKKNFSFCWYHFYKFIFDYLFTWRKELSDFDTVCIGLIILYNASLSENLIMHDIDINTWSNRISNADKTGLNSSSISDITGIPRLTVVRKVNSLVEKGFAIQNEKKMISIKFDKKVFKKTQKIQKKTIENISQLIFKILNQASIS